MKRTRYNAVANHVFGGGMLVGFEQAGINVLADLETFAIGVKTLSLNRPKLEIRQDPDAKTWEPKKYCGCDMLFGNPRCTSFSTLTVGLKHRHGSTGASTLDIRQSFALANIIRPKIFCLESVQGCATTGWTLIQKLADQMPKDYRFAIVFVNNAAFTSQHRKRLFVIGYRDCEYGPNPPKVSDKMILVQDRIKDLENLEWEVIRGKADADAEPCEHKTRETTLYNHWVFNAFDDKRLSSDHKKVPAGTTLDDVDPRELSKALREKREDGVGLSFHCIRRLAYDIMSPLIYAASGNYLHPVHDRSITVREAARLMGVPDDYRYKGGSQYAQVGNGVAPPTAKWIASTLIEALDGDHEDVSWSTDRKTRELTKGPGNKERWKFFNFTKIVPADFEKVRLRQKEIVKAISDWKTESYGDRIFRALEKRAAERKATNTGGLLKGKQVDLSFDNGDGAVEIS
jgi:DNA (cytosine-5)-methyltransferase 1